MQSYLDYFSGSQWDNVWCVLKGRALYLYSSAIDETSQDAVALSGWSVERCGEMEFQLNHKEYESERFRAETGEEVTRWVKQLNHACTNRITIAGLNLETPDMYEGEKKASVDEAVLREQKQQLLQEVLNERKTLLAKLKIQDDPATTPPGPDESTVDEPEDQVEEDEDKYLREVMKLRQRKTSMQLKLGTFQKQLQEKKKTKKPKFRLNLSMRSKSQDTMDAVPTAEELCYEQHVKELSDKLSTVEKDLRLKEQTLLKKSKDIGVLQKKPAGQVNRNPSAVSTRSEPSSKSLKSRLAKPLPISISTSALPKSSSTSPISKQSVAKSKSHAQLTSKSSSTLSSRHSWSPEEFAAAMGSVQLDVNQNEDSEKEQNQKAASGHSQLSPKDKGKREKGQSKPRSLQRGSSWNAARSREANKQEVGVNKQEVKAETIARIEAFEELLQQKLTF